MKKINMKINSKNYLIFYNKKIKKQNKSNN